MRRLAMLALVGLCACGEDAGWDGVGLPPASGPTNQCDRPLYCPVGGVYDGGPAGWGGLETTEVCRVDGDIVSRRWTWPDGVVAMWSGPEYALHCGVDGEAEVFGRKDGGEVVCLYFCTRSECADLPPCTDEPPAL